jgi:hypothetical protein
LDLRFRQRAFAPLFFAGNPFSRRLPHFVYILWKTIPSESGVFGTGAAIGSIAAWHRSSYRR